MSFFAPWMLLGLVFATAPVIIHLMRRRTANKVLWGAWMFLQETMQRKRRKLLIEDMILLAVRTLILLLAAFAFARPFFPELHFFGGRGMDKDVAIVLDTSASMRLHDLSGRSAFDRAVDEAKELVKLSPRGTAFAIILGDKTPLILTPTPVSSKREILDLLDKVEPGLDTMDAARTLVAVGEVLAGGNNPAKEVIIYGDGQAYGWRPEAEGEWKRVEKAFSRFLKRPPVVWRVMERPEQVRNAAIAALVPSRRIIGMDRPVNFSATVVNSGSEALAPGDIVFLVDGQEISRSPIGQILPSLSRTFSFPCTFKSAGKHVVMVEFTNTDDIPSDNSAECEVTVIDKIPVLLVNGRPAEKGFGRPTAFIEAALHPEVKNSAAQFLVETKTIRAGALEGKDSYDGMGAVILCDVPTLTPGAITNLEQFVRKGGGLITIPGERCGAPLYTNELFSVCWNNFNSSLEDVTFEGAPVSSRVEFDELLLTNKIDVVSRFSDGAAAVINAEYGKGRTAICAFQLSPVATALPARPAFVPFVHEMLYSIVGTNSVSYTVDAKWRSREGDLKMLTPEESETLAVYIDLGCARSADDAYAAIVGKSFGLEVWRPFAIIAFLLLIFELYLCRRFDRERGGEIPSRLRLALRIIAFLSLIWMLLHICWTHDVKRKIHRRVAVFTDRSLSMLREDYANTNRLDIATNTAAAVAGKLGERYDIETFDFGGETTDFAAALETALERLPSEELAGAVFVTDGVSTEEATPEAAARRFARLGAKVTTFVTGSTNAVIDAAIASVTVPETVFLGDKVRPLIILTATGLDKQPLQVRFLEGDRLIDSREYVIDGANWKKEFRFTDDPGEAGTRHYRVEIVTNAEEAESRNNVWPFDTVINDDRTNVLIIERRPRWEFRYLRNLFYARDKSVHLQYVLLEPDRISGITPKEIVAADATRDFGDAEAGALPKTRNDWRKFDVIILGDLEPGTLTPAVQEDIRYCVEERAALLVISSGAAYMPRSYNGSTLADMLPVSLTNETGRLTADWENVSAPFAITPAGRAHPITRLSSSASETDRVWQSLPPTRGHVAGLDVRPGSEVLLCAGDGTANTKPLLVTRGFGRGKVVFLATDDTWLLRYRVGDTYHHRFWGNIAGWASGEKLRDGDRFTRAGTDAVAYRTGSEVRLIAKLLGRDYLPITGAKPVGAVKMPDGRVREFNLVEREGQNGYYEAVFNETERLGRYEYTLESGADRVTSVFTVREPTAPIEYTRLSAERKTGELMARLTGGSVYDSFNEETELDFGAAKSEIIEHIDDPIWDHPFAMILLAASLITLWILRKQKGLA